MNGSAQSSPPSHTLPYPPLPHASLYPARSVVEWEGIAPCYVAARSDMAKGKGREGIRLCGLDVDAGVDVGVDVDVYELWTERMG